MVVSVCSCVMKAKAAANDLSVSISNSTEDTERPERAAGLGAGRSWVDPSVKMQVCEGFPSFAWLDRYAVMCICLWLMV